MKATEAITAKAIETTPAALVVILSDRRVEIPWAKCSQRLSQATETERRAAELSPGGYGIHWPLIDEDLAIGPLISR